MTTRKLVELAIEDITFGDRVRTELNDIARLARSIKENGLVHPIRVTTDNVLVAGRRRIAAYDSMGKPTIPAHIEDVESVRRSEVAENVERVAFTPREMYRGWLKIKDEIADALAIRQAEGQDRGRAAQGADVDIVDPQESAVGDDIIDPDVPTELRQQAAARLGTSHRTLEKIIAVEEAAIEDPELYGDVVELMAEDNVSKAHNELLKRRIAADIVLEQMTTPAPKRAKIKLGEIWAVGPHRIACGDATDREVYERLLGDRAIDLVFTDPPYGEEYIGGSKPRTALDNDDRGTEVAAEVFEVLKDFLPKGTAWYVCSPSKNSLHNMLHAVDLLGPLRYTLVWVKDNSTFGRGHYKWRHEFILYGWTEGAANPWYGGETPDTVWEVSRPPRSDEHPTMKPTALTVKALHHSTQKGDMMLDPFAGSGSSLVACVDTGRIGYGIELKPMFAQHTLDRLVEATGETAVRL